MMSNFSSNTLQPILAIVVLSSLTNLHLLYLLLFRDDQKAVLTQGILTCIVNYIIECIP